VVWRCELTGSDRVVAWSGRVPGDGEGVGHVRVGHGQGPLHRARVQGAMEIEATISPNSVLRDQFV
jgi:hypothetical protein